MNRDTIRFALELVGNVVVAIAILVILGLCFLSVFILIGVP